jgi:PAS domain S-box-containing protein
MPTIMAVAWFGGRGPGLLATAVGVLEAAYLFFDPPFSLWVEDSKEVFILVVFGGMGTALTMLIERLQEAEHARRQAEERILLQTRHTLQDRDERLQAILNTAVDAIVTIDQDGIIESVNPATERLFGYTAAELIGQNVTILMPSPYQNEHDGYLAHYLATGERRLLGNGREIEARRKDGTLFPVDLAVSEVEPRRRFTGILRDITRRKELEREVVEIASLEQRRIGQDLHDTVSQELTALSMTVADLEEALGTDPAVVSSLLTRIVQGLHRSQRELRTVVRGLLPVPVDTEGLMAALADLAARTQQEGKVHCLFDCPEPVAITDNLVATQLYLIAQEAVHNAVKHARARTVRITLRHTDGVLMLSAEDDGTGMPAKVTVSQGLGLRIMRNRSAILRARLTIEPAQPSGTRVSCVLPRRNHERE